MHSTERGVVMDRIEFETFEDLRAACKARDPDTFEAILARVYEGPAKNTHVRYYSVLKDEKAELEEFVSVNTGREHQRVLRTQNHQFRILNNSTFADKLPSPLVIVYPADYPIELNTI